MVAAGVVVLVVARAIIHRYTYTCICMYIDCVYIASLAIVNRKSYIHVYISKFFFLLPRDREREEKGRKAREKRDGQKRKTEGEEREERREKREKKETKSGEKRELLVVVVC